MSPERDGLGPILHCNSDLIPSVLLWGGNWRETFFGFHRSTKAIQDPDPATVPNIGTQAQPIKGGKLGFNHGLYLSQALADEPHT